MFNRRLVPSIALVAALQACAPSAVPVAPTAPTAPTEVAQAGAPAPAAPAEPLPAANLAGTATLFDLPFTGATVRLSRLGSPEAIGSGTVAADGTFAVATPDGLAAGALLLATATKDGQTIVTLYQAPKSAYALAAALAAAPAVALDADTTAAYALIAPRLAGCLQAGTTQAASDAYLALARALTGLVKRNLSESAKHDLFTAIGPDGVAALTEATRRTLGLAATSAQRAAFITATGQLASAIASALGTTGVTIDPAALAPLGFGNASAPAVTKSAGGSGGSGGSGGGGSTPHNGTADVTIGAPEDGLFDPQGTLSASAPTAAELSRTIDTGAGIYDMATDALGNVWTLSQSSFVTRVAPDGTLRKTSGGGDRIAVDAQGNAWFTNQTSGTVTRVAADGTTATYPTGGGSIGVAVDADGNAWVASLSTDSVTRVSPAGSTITYPASSLPFGVAVDAQGRAWVPSMLNRNVTVINADGSPAGTYPCGYGARAITIDRFGNAWIVNQYDATVTRISPDFLKNDTYPTNGTYPDYIAVDADGNAWVTNTNQGVTDGSGSVVTRVSADGTVQHFAASAATYGVATDAHGRAWVANYHDNTVSLFSPTGTVLATYPVGNGPLKVRVDAQGYAWVGGDSGILTKLTY